MAEGGKVMVDNADVTQGRHRMFPRNHSRHRLPDTPAVALHAGALQPGARTKFPSRVFCVRNSRTVALRTRSLTSGVEGCMVANSVILLTIYLLAGPEGNDDYLARESCDRCAAQFNSCRPTAQAGSACADPCTDSCSEEGLCGQRWRRGTLERQRAVQWRRRSFVQPILWSAEDLGPVRIGRRSGRRGSAV